MTNAVAKMDSSMLDDAGKTSNRTPSVYDVLHKVSIYNPDYSKGETMDISKQGMFRVKEANTGEDKLIAPFKFNLLAVAKVLSGKITLLTEFGDVLRNEKGEAVTQFFYSNEFSQFTKKTETLGFRNMTSKPQFFTKEQLQAMLISPKINGHDNPFFERKKKQDGEPYNSTLVKNQTLIFGKFIGGEYDGQFFNMYVKNSALGTTYSKGEQVEPEDGTFLKAIEVTGLNALNEALVNDGRPTIKSAKPNQFDLEVSITSKDVMGKTFNVAYFDFSGLTAMRTNNLEDVEYISKLRNDYFVERFEGFKSPTPITVANGNAVVEFKFEVPETKGLIEEAIEELSADDVEEMYDNPKAQAVHTAAKKSGAPF